MLAAYLRGHLNPRPPQSLVARLREECIFEALAAELRLPVLLAQAQTMAGLMNSYHLIQAGKLTDETKFQSQLFERLSRLAELDILARRSAPTLGADTQFILRLAKMMKLTEIATA